MRKKKIEVGRARWILTRAEIETKRRQIEFGIKELEIEKKETGKWCMYPTQKKRIIKKKHGFHKKIESENRNSKYRRTSRRASEKQNNPSRKQQG
jgi:hypothetical protein